MEDMAEEPSKELPPPAPQSKGLPNDLGNSEDDAMSSTLSCAGTPEGKELANKQRVHLAKNKKADQARINCVKENVTQMQIHQDSHPGHIPNGLGIIQIRSCHECNNSLWRTLGCQFFYSALTNTIYVRKTGAFAEDLEGTYLAAFMLQDNRWLYSILP
jgi:hypothetical protein